MEFYNLKSDGQDYRITKFNADLDPSTSYKLSDTTCECPAFTSNRVKDCRHHKMLPLMKDRVDTFWFYCYTDGTWHDPTGAYAAGIDPLPEHSATEAQEAEAHSQVVKADSPIVSSTPAAPAALPAKVITTTSPAIRRRV